MAKTRSKMNGKPKYAIKKSKKKGPNIASNVIRTKSMDVVIGVAPWSIQRMGKMTLENNMGEGEIQRIKDAHQDFMKVIRAKEQCNSTLAQGFAKRIWKDKVDRVRMLAYGIFIIRFCSVGDRDSILNGGYIFFSRRLEYLDLKYWGKKLLFKIVGQLGNPIMIDDVTKERDRHNYPRILVEVMMNRDFQNLLEFEDEFGSNTHVGVKYEWKPTCSHCAESYKGEKVKEQEKPVETMIENTFSMLADSGITNPGITDDVANEQEDRESSNRGKKPFKYFRMWKSHPEYETKLREIWSQQVYGTKMYQVVSKLKALKQVFKEINRKGLSSLQSTTVQASSNLDDIQGKLQLDPPNHDLISADWKLEPNGTRWNEPHQIIKAFVTYYKSLLKSQMEGRKREDVKQALFGIPRNKASGPDGFSSFFFQDNWELLGEDLYYAVTSFLETGPQTLLPNPSKSATYSSNMARNELERIVAAAGFSVKEMHFTYLGVPIYTKKISRKECVVLADKMTARIKIWSSGNLSFVGRVVLINSVLMAIHAY
uniref:Uncharacterized protein n=1 Tax=Cannabis sativa TaxID=3483 RepID=A0A803PTH7_CANSA